MNNNTTENNKNDIDQIRSCEVMEDNEIESSDSIYLGKSIGKN